MMPRSSKLLCALGSLLLIVFLGCADERKDKRSLYQVTGKILHKGQPLKDCYVTFHKVSESAEDLKLMKSSGQTNAEGVFVGCTNASGDGVPAGEYVLTFAGMKSSEDNERPASGDIFNNKYADPKKNAANPKFKVTVKDSKNELAPITLD